MAKDTEERFRKELKLTEEQISKLHPMFLRNAEAIHGFDVETMQKIDAYLDRVRDEFVAQLTPEQAASYKEWEARRKEYFDKKSKSGHHGDKGGHK
jgi:Spy/CpxP family protein refolding chaperone